MVSNGEILVNWEAPQHVHLRTSSRLNCTTVAEKPVR